MKATSLVISTLLLCIAYLLAAVDGMPSYIGRRGVTDQQFKLGRGGMLFKNDKQTTCEIGLLGPSAGFISANCLDLDKNKTVSPDTTYKAFIYTGKPGSQPSEYTVEHSDIHIHPQYDESTFINNVAVIEFNKDTTETYKTYVFSNYYVVDNSSYSSRYFDIKKNGWGVPEVEQQLNDPTDKCNSLSDTYEANPQKLSCNEIQTRSLVNPSCTIPYSALYTMVGEQMVLVGLYSYSVVLGMDACKGERINYYTYMKHYLFFAAEVLGRPIDVYYDSQVATTDSFEGTFAPMVQGKTADMKDKLLIGGDIYALQDDTPESNTSTTASATNSNTDGETPANTTSATPTGEPEQIRTNSKKNQNIVIGIAVPVAVILLLAALFVSRHLWKKYKMKSTWDPTGESLRMRELANELVVDIGDTHDVNSVGIHNTANQNENEVAIKEPPPEYQPNNTYIANSGFVNTIHEDESSKKQ